MAERPDIFQGVSSLADDFDGTIENSRFGKNPRYNFDGQMPVVLSFDLSSPDLEEPEAMILSIGNGYKATNNGTNAELETPRSSGKTGFQDGSNIQRYIDRMFEIDENAVIARYENTGFGPNDARFWDGLTSHFMREKTEREARENKPGRLMPTGFIRWDDEPPAKKAPTKATATKKKKTAAPKAKDNGAGEIDPAVLELIDSIADESEDFDSFIAEVFSQVEAAAEEPLYSKVMEGEDVEGSIWQRAVARAEE